MRPIPSFQSSCRNDFALLKRRTDHLSGLIRCSGIAAAMILLTVGIVRAQAIQQADVGTAVTHISQKSTVGMALIVRSAQKAAILPLTGTPRASILFNVLLGKTPASIPVLSSFPDPTGVISTYTPKGAIATSNNPFFSTAITGNGRSCLTCHVPQSGWEISPPQIQTIYAATSGKAPLFQPIDSANCPDTPGASSPTSVHARR